MKVAIGSDHGGFSLKKLIVPFLRAKGHEVIDVGAYDEEPSDYPDFAEAVSKTIIKGEAERGILICGSGVGTCIVANKFTGIRASVCHDTYSAHQGVEHDDMNVLCLGARIVGIEVVKELITAFLSASLKQEERYIRRLKKVEEIEQQNL